MTEIHVVIKSDSTYRVKGDSKDLVLSSIVEMSQRKRRPEGETLYIDETDRQRIVAAMVNSKPPWTKAALARECKVTPSAMTLLLKKPIPRRETRGCKFIPELQRALGIAITTKTPAIVGDKEAAKRALRIVRELADPAALENWLTSGEYIAGKR